MSTTREIAILITNARKMKKLKQEVLCSLAGCSRSYISKLENGRSLPSSVIAARIEKALGLKRGALIGVILAIRKKELRLKKEAMHKARYGG